MAGRNSLGGQNKNALAAFFNTRDWMKANQEYGPRTGGAAGMKGLGYFGPVSRPDGDVSTELSAEAEGINFPLMVPTLTRQELDHILSGGSPTDEIYRKAYMHAIERGRSGKDPFATQYDTRSPLPK